METQFTKRTFTKTQVSLLTKSMLIAGIAFLILGGASFGWMALFTSKLEGNDIYRIGFPIFMITLILGMVVSMMWVANMLKNGSVGLTVSCYLLYILSESVAFGWLFGIADHEGKGSWLGVLFFVVAFAFLMSTLIAKVISFRSIITMGKIMGIVGITMLVSFLMFFILMLVNIFVWNPGVGMAQDTFCLVIMLGMTVVSFLYLIIDIWSISKVSEFQDMTGQEFPKIMTWFCGFRLLTDLVNVLFILLLWLIRFSRR